jgi:hypothetical protein
VQFEVVVEKRKKKKKKWPGMFLSRKRGDGSAAEKDS